MKQRKNWDEYFLEICLLIAERATCDRAHVGAIIVDKHNRILSTGYNGALPDMPHCDDVGHDMLDGHCVRTVHAEVNAVCQAAALGISLAGTKLYCTHSPCWDCTKTIVAAGIEEVVYLTAYQSKHDTRTARIDALVKAGKLHMKQIVIPFYGKE